MRDSISKTGAGGAKPGGSGPDPNQVWNKNRPVQAPPPQKHLTDEELKQQYGIHMTSRIQEDSGGTESKWADIDDDEDDWAPETIEWGDGTKVQINPPPDHPSLPEESPQAPTEVPEQELVAQEAPRIVAPKPTTSVGPNPTVLRIGASAERQAKAASISSRGTNDRMPSGSTSPAPPPAKSPWAALPPVERVSPVNSSLQPPPPVPQSRGHANYSHREDGHHPALPPQEIAADDFNRTWRETTSGAPRELYNSRSGRYEPVADNRRPSWRQDQGPRPPAVLQRSGHDEHAGPAEPSAAFQTHRSSHQDGMRRRTSSNVSGGSGSFGRRPSFGRDMPPPRYNDARRGSYANGMVDPALLPVSREPGHVREVSPNRQRAGSGFAAPPSVSVGSESSPVENQPAPIVAPEVPQEDPLVLQERIMKEKRLEARQRRQEQEEQERLAKEERIRQKLAALGPAPDKKRKDSIESRKPQVSATDSSPTAVITSPPKPPVPEPSGEPKQYGMMKVHHPDSVKKFIAANERDRASEKQADRTSPHTRRVTTTSHHDSSQQHHHPAPPPSSSTNHPSEPRPSDAIVDEQDSQQRGNLNISNSFAPWSTGPNLASTPPTVNNLWKPMIGDRTLGNGIFDPSLGGFSSREINLRNQIPAMPAAQSFPPQEAAPIPSLPSPETRHVSYDPLSPIGRPGPIGPPSSQPQLKNDRLNSWNNFGITARKSEAEANQKYRQEFNEAQKLRQENQRDQPKPPSKGSVWRKVVVGEDGSRRIVSETTNGDSKSPTQAALEPAVEPAVKTAVEPAVEPTARPGHTWKQIRVGEDGVRRHVAVHHVPGTQTSKPAQTPTNPLNGLEPPADGLSFAEGPARPITNMPARSSRFFPNVTEQPKRFGVEHLEVQRSPSPPPPEEYSHPVYSNGSARPLVHFPPAKPVVKLPPKAMPAAPAPPRTFASMAAAPPQASPIPAPSSAAISWQDKFNGLFGKKTPPEKKSVLAVASATKEPLDVQLPAASVSVSFPNRRVEIESTLQTGDGDLAARQVAEEEAIFEDREPGSQPGVRVPNMAPAAAWHAPAPPPPSRVRQKNVKPMRVHSIDIYWVGSGERDPQGNTRVSVRLPGQETSQTLLMPRKIGQNRHRNPSQPKTARKPLKRPRDVSGGSTWNKKPSSSQQSSVATTSSRHQSRNASWGPRNQSGSQ
ncbi:hypothetical protein N7466_004031 [Penicillium verhagenii]|uniref:uncharacterized protein n=1 Tax=Penicillium verhagenii TaxID=1562060 RepID=UPI002544F5B2|nr:uncharacterized protein N7466_004031 [Penicillium verhagenii]KAJ5934484.1 hypothetical protein N7466_004031 [Penicillium verhagenii]